MATKADLALGLMAADPREQIPAEKKQRARPSMDVRRQKLSHTEIPGYHTHWFSDDPGRIHEATKCGWEFVESHEVFIEGDLLSLHAGESGNTDLGSRVSQVVGVSKFGTPVLGFLMKLKDEWWEEDQERKNEAAQVPFQGMRQGQSGPNEYGRSYTVTKSHSPY